MTDHRPQTYVDSLRSLPLFFLFPSPLTSLVSRQDYELQDCELQSHPFLFRSSDVLTGLGSRVMGAFPLEYSVVSMRMCASWGIEQLKIYGERERHQMMDNPGKPMALEQIEL